MNCPKVKIALVDDDKLQRMLLKTLLGQDERFDLLFNAEHGAAFLSRLREAITLPEIVIIDLHMPVMDGVDTILQVKRYWPAIKILAYTNSVDEEEKAKTLHAGANFVINKGIGIVGLTDILMQIYRSSNS